MSKLALNTAAVASPYPARISSTTEMSGALQANIGVFMPLLSNGGHLHSFDLIHRPRNI